MRIIPKKYIEETEIARWLIFDSIIESEISLIFARRLAALAKNNNRKLTISEGFRTFERQQYFYDLYINGGGNVAAKPGTSHHEFHVAIDVHDDTDSFWHSKSITGWANKSRLNQTELNKYGLCSPMNSIDGSVIEWWHLTPIEYYMGYTGLLKDFLQPDDAIVNWGAEEKRVKEIDQIMISLKRVLDAPDYWQRVLEGREVANPTWLRSLIVKSFSDNLLMVGLVGGGILTSKDYWLKVLKGQEKCNPEWLRVLLLRLL